MQIWSHTGGNAARHHCLRQTAGPKRTGASTAARRPVKLGVVDRHGLAPPAGQAPALVDDNRKHRAPRGFHPEHWPHRRGGAAATQPIRHPEQEGLIVLFTDLGDELFDRIAEDVLHTAIDTGTKAPPYAAPIGANSSASASRPATEASTSRNRASSRSSEPPSPIRVLCRSSSGLPDTEHLDGCRAVASRKSIPPTRYDPARRLVNLPFPAAAAGFGY